ncbi:endonuclease/exonuclease/phosphatase family protein [Streptomyces sp. B29(2018)]|uniref:endonuclease/exonuclease/phosphatase family protein n=1 Tax=Streptomyces sp. B29(2018) TaxID=2485016 RepID=UPI000FD67CC7|nr:endonuclease/exonuclease/phosphatase family protein [Streptomyces sp. B29(2018)]
MRTQQLRIGTYNIHEADGELAGRQIEMLATHDLDILSVQECGGTGWLDSDNPHLWEGTGPVLERYARGLGMEGVAARSRADHRHTALLWRSGRIRRRSTTDYSRVTHRTFAGHHLTIDGIGDLSVMTVHAHHANGEVRYTEAKHMANLSAGGRRAALVGDFNSVHGKPRGERWAHLAEPDLEPDIDRLPDNILASQALLDAAGDPVLDDQGRPLFDRRPSKVLGIGGFIDVAAELLAPEERQQTGAFLHADAPRRLDRIYTNGLAPVAIETVEDPKAQLSDHYLVIATITV